MKMIRPIEVKALKEYQIWIKYPDGTNGVIDLSNYMGKGIFKLWDDYNYFSKVYINEGGGIAWGDEIDLCPDVCYMKLTNRTPEQLFPSLKEEEINA